MKYIITLLIVVLFIACSSDQRTPKYEADWESLNQWECPEWYKDSKLGIFIHWGVYSVPAYGNEWYPRHMYIKSDDPEDPYNHHQKLWGDQKEFGYKDFIPLFKAEQWDPQEWIDLFIKAGVTYVIPVAEHHDAFAMYHSTHTRWNSVNMGPKRDILGELFKEGRKRGLKMGASSHFLFNWYYYTHEEAFDTSNPENWDLYGKPHKPMAQMDKEFLDHMWNRTTEIVDKYKPDIMWFDFVTSYPYLETQNKKFAAYYYNRAIEWGKEVAINVKGESYPKGACVHDIERGKYGKMSKHFWQTDNSISNISWGYIENDNFKSTNTLVDDLVDIVSKNGCILWSIGPKSDGTIPEELKQRLLELGKWMDINKEAINGTRPWIIYGEGPTKVEEGFFLETSNREFTDKDIRFTVKDNHIYAIVLDWPKDHLVIHSFGKNDIAGLNVKSLNLLGYEGQILWERNDQELVIQIPKKKPCDHAFVFKITVEGKVLGKIDYIIDDDNLLNLETILLDFTNSHDSEKIRLQINQVDISVQDVRCGSLGRADISLHAKIDTEGKNEIVLRMNDEVLTKVDIFYPFIQLKGPWKFREDDSEDWKEPSFDDSNWSIVNLPNIEKKQKAFEASEQMIWYRKSIHIPQIYAGHSLELPFGEIWEVNDIYFNGHLIKTDGEFPPTHEGPNYESNWCLDRYYDIPPDIIKYGQENIIALKVYSKFKDNGPVDEIMKYVHVR